MSRETILIVDDSPNIRRAAEKRLQSCGYATVAVGNLSETLKMANDEEVDAILLDVQLPDGSGLDAVSELKAGVSRPAIVIMTGHGSEETAVKAMRLGADDYLVKPVRGVDLERTLNEVLERRSREQEAEAEAAALAEDVSAASAVQRRLEQTELPQPPGWQLAARLDPARSIGGDMYGAVQKGGRLHVWVGDISGKGTAAALLAAAVRTLIRNQAKEANDPRRVVARTAHVVFDDLTDSESFLTLMLGTIDLASGKARFVDAGHDHARVRRTDGQWEPIVCPAMLPIGFEVDPNPSASTVALEPGDTLVLYSDGLVDLGEEPAPAAGTRLLEEQVDETISSGLAEATEAVFSGVASVEQSDDRTLMLVRRSSN